MRDLAAVFEGTGVAVQRDRRVRPFPRPRVGGSSFTVTATNKISVVQPADGSVAPPGMYMLFVTSNPASTGGVKIPSIAVFVKLP